jgi:Ca2+-binding RTX toxin-like protein
MATGEGTDTLSGLEVVIGSNSDDILTGGSGNDTLIGGLGNDLLDGGSGIDTVIEQASAGTDQVRSSINYLLGDNYKLFFDNDINFPPN